MNHYVATFRATKKNFTSVQGTFFCPCFLVETLLFFSFNFQADPNGCEVFGKPPKKEPYLFFGGHFFGIPDGRPGRADFKQDFFYEKAENVVSNFVKQILRFPEGSAVFSCSKAVAAHFLESTVPSRFNIFVMPKSTVPSRRMVDLFFARSYSRRCGVFFAVKSIGS